MTKEHEASHQSHASRVRRGREGSSDV